MEPIQVLIVEDDRRVSEIQRLFTEKVSGFSVIGIALSIAEAEEMLAILKPDLVLLDIYFPEGNGIDLLWKIRSHYRSVDVILITAAKEVNILQEAIRGGVFDYILKPIVFDRFRNTLNKFFDYRSKITEMKTVDQLDVDGLLHPVKPATSNEDLMPKGIDAITLEKIITVIDTMAEVGITADKVGKLIGVSRTTARRYLEYLVSSGTVGADLSYGTVGRPERIYLRLGGRSSTGT
ncbi:response regulator [bacterium]|nr:response regulator [bacterium]